MFNNKDVIKKDTEYGLVVTCVGDSGEFSDFGESDETCNSGETGDFGETANW